MANSVNVQMGVSGVAQFQEGMKKAQTSVKTLDEALKLNEKQFELTGNAEEYMAKKSDTLKRQIELQKGVVSQAEQALAQMKKQGVDPASTAFQSMEAKSLKAKAQLAEMQTKLQNVGKESEEAGNKASEMNEKLEGIGKQLSLETVISGINKITGALEAAAKKAWQLGQAIVTNTLGAGQWADELMTTATVYGITPEELQRMRKTADLIDTEADTIIKAQSKMKKAMGNEGSKETMGAFAALGIDPTTSHGDWEKVFWDAGEALKNWGDEVEQEEYAQRLFGKSWKELLPLFSAGREEYEKMYKSWNVVSDDALDNLGKLDDQYQKFDNELETLRNEFFAALAPSIESVLGTLTELMSEFNKYLQTDDGKEMLEAMGNAVSGLFTDLSKIDPQQVMEGFKGAFDSIIEGFKWLDEHKSDVVKALEVVTAGWATMKLTGGVLEVIKLISGLQWLSKNPKITVPNLGGGGTGTSGGAGTGEGTGKGGTATFGAAVGKFLTSTPAKVIGGAGTFLYTLLKPAETAADDEEVLAELNQNKRPVGFDVSNTPTSAGDARLSSDTTEAQRQAAEAFWDAIKTYAMDPENPELMKRQKEFEDAYEGQHALYNKIEGMIYELMDSNPDWTSLEDLPDELWQSKDREGAAMDRMTEVAGENATAIRTMDQNSIKPSHIDSFARLPNEIYEAVAQAMKNIVINIDGQRASTILSPMIGDQLGRTVRAIIGG